MTFTHQEAELLYEWLCREHYAELKSHRSENPPNESRANLRNQLFEELLVKAEGLMRSAKQRQMAGGA